MYTAQIITASSLGALGHVICPEDKYQQLVYESVVADRASRRSGTACTKTKGEVSGSGAKPWRQKGTGRARAGYKRSPIWRGGGVVFGPRPRSYAKKINAKSKVRAVYRAVSDKIRSGQVYLLEDINLGTHKTKSAVKFFHESGLPLKLAIITDCADKNLIAATHNLRDCSLFLADYVTAEEILTKPIIAFTKNGLNCLFNRLQ